MLLLLVIIISLPLVQEVPDTLDVSRDSTTVLSDVAAGGVDSLLTTESSRKPVDTPAESILSVRLVDQSWSASDWISLFAIISGSIFTAFGVWLTYRARKDPFKRSLYDQQFKILAEIIEVLTPCYYHAGQIVAASVGTDRNTIQTLQSNLFNQYERFAPASLKGAMILPKEVVDELNNIQKTMRHLLNASQEELREEQSEMTSRLADDYERFGNVARKWLGTDVLADETLKGIAKSPQYREE